MLFVVFLGKAAHRSPRGRGNEADLWEFFGSFADHQPDSYKKTYVGSGLKTLQDDPLHWRDILWRLGENQRGNGHRCISFLFSWLIETAGSCIC